MKVTTLSDLLTGDRSIGLITTAPPSLRQESATSGNATEASPPSVAVTIGQAPGV
jgi:hypothetical protein